MPLVRLVPRTPLPEPDRAPRLIPVPEVMLDRSIPVPLVMPLTLRAVPLATWLILSTAPVEPVSLLVSWIRPAVLLLEALLAWVIDRAAVLRAPLVRSETMLSWPVKLVTAL